MSIDSLEDRIDPIANIGIVEKLFAGTLRSALREVTQRPILFLIDQ